MSYDGESLKILPVKVDRTALVTLQVGTSLQQRHPVIGVWTNFLDHTKHIITSKDLSNGGVPTYEIFDVQLVDGDDTSLTAVKLLFYRQGSQTHSVSSVVNDHGYGFEMIVPIHDLAVVQALRMAPESCFFAIFDARHANPSTDRSVRLSDMLVAVTLPSVETVESDEIVEKLQFMVSDSFTTPFSPLFDDEEGEDDVPLSVRKAQGFLLSTLVGMSLGDEVSLRRLLALEDQFNDFYERVNGRSEDTSEDDADQIAFVSAVLQLLRIVLVRSGMSPGTHLDPDDHPEISPLGTADHDAEFMDIMKHLEIENDLRRIGAQTKREGTELIRFSSQAATIHKPFADGCPESMKQLFNNPVLAERDPLWELDLTEDNPDEDNEALENAPFAHVTIASALVIAARAARMAEVLRENSGQGGDLHPTIPLVRWLTGDDDVYMWELMAMSPLVEGYETLQFADLLNFSNAPEEDPTHALYFTITVHTLAHQLQHEEWTPQTFAKALDQLDVQFPEVKQVALHLLNDIEQYSLEEEDDDDDAPCTAAKATHALSTSGIPLSHLANAVARLVPVMADVQASKNNLPVGDEEWKKFRKQYIDDLLRQIAATTSRNFAG